MNAASQFSEFVKRQQRPVSVEDGIDWLRERDEWLGFLDGLYETISQYLAGYVEAGEIVIHDSTIDLNEENIGTYAARRLVIVIGAQEIVFTPVGTRLIGSKGRVDVQGSAGHSRLVLIDREVIDAYSMFKVDTASSASGDPSLDLSMPMGREWAWKIVSAPPLMRFVELNEESFFAMLMEVGNG